MRAQTTENIRTRCDPLMMTNWNGLWAIYSAKKKPKEGELNQNEELMELMQELIRLLPVYLCSPRQAGSARDSCGTQGTGTEGRRDQRWSEGGGGGGDIDNNVFSLFICYSIFKVHARSEEGKEDSEPEHLNIERDRRRRPGY